MKKRVVMILIVACLLAGSVFAAQGSFRVGGHVGWGFDWTAAKMQLFGGKIIDRATSNGFNFAIDGEYEFIDGFSAKVEVGAMTMGKLSTYSKSNEGEETVVADKATPMNFDFYVGAKYEAPINEQFGAFGGIGFDVMLGKQSADEDEKVNARIGLGIEAGGLYYLNDNLSINLGARYSVYLINTSQEVRDFISYLKDHNGSLFQHGLKIFAGASYSL